MLLSKRKIIYRYALITIYNRLSIAWHFCAVKGQVMCAVMTPTIPRPSCEHKQRKDYHARFPHEHVLERVPNVELHPVGGGAQYHATRRVAAHRLSGEGVRREAALLPRQEARAHAGGRAAARRRGHHGARRGHAARRHRRVGWAAPPPAAGHDAHRRRVRAGGAAGALPGGSSRGAGAHRLVRHRALAGAAARRRDRLRARGGVLRQERLRRGACSPPSTSWRSALPTRRLPA